MQINEKNRVLQQQNRKSIENLLLLKIVILLSASIISCNKSASNGKKGVAPSIVFESISSDSMQVGTDKFINIRFGFRDEDGDLGNSTASGNYDIYTFDQRDSNEVNYYFPRGITESIDPTQGVSGKCDLALQAAFQNLRPNRPLRDTVRLEIYIKDKAGNKSNTILIPNIYLTP